MELKKNNQTVLQCWELLQSVKTNRKWGSIRAKNRALGGYTEPAKGAIQLRTRTKRNKDVYSCNTWETRGRRITERYRWGKPTEWTVSFRHNTRSERRWTASLHGSFSCRTTGLHTVSLSMEHCRLLGVRFEDGDETWFVSAKRQAASLCHSGLWEALQSSFVFWLDVKSILKQSLPAALKCLNVSTWWQRL